MPVIARFYGLIIKMFLLGTEHNPPHIHVVYGEHNATFEVRTALMTEGDLPPRAQAMVIEWINLHQHELIEIWETQEFKTLPPLK